jgi:acetyltransferase
MLTNELLNPNSIVIVGASNDVEKPGGKVLKNVLDGKYDGALYAVNPKEDTVQGIKCFKDVTELPQCDLAILAIASKYIPATMRELTKNKGTKGFIILSAGFSEIGEDGAKLEREIVEIANEAGAGIIGPNCIGVLTPRYNGVFAGPIPKLQHGGIDFVTGSGATAVFILECAIPMGLTFASLYSVGNSAQLGVEEVLKYWDETFDPATSSKVKMIYLEKVDKPDLFLKHASSLIRKGCKIAAIKSGSTDAGSRAASSHTGALAGSDSAVDALFRKAGVARCYSREELVYVCAAYSHKELTGKNIAVITHAGGPGVMATDALAKNNMNVPHIEGPAAEELLTKLFHGSSVANPIDFIATGTAEQLGIILDYVDNKFDNIDGSIVIFGTTGLFNVTEVYKTLHEKMNTCKKPIFPVLPSPVQAAEETEYFKSLGRCFFPDEVNIANAIGKIYHADKPEAEISTPSVDTKKIRATIDSCENGYISPKAIQDLLDAAGIARAKEIEVSSVNDAVAFVKEIGFPVVMKVVGPLHKSDVGGVSLNVNSVEKTEAEFERLMKIKDAKAVLIQNMLSGREIFVGAKYEPKFGHIVLCGLGGIFIEVLKDVSSMLTPISKTEAAKMIRSLKSYKLIQGVRGQEGVNEDMFADAIQRVSALLEAAPEIQEMDLNPLLGKSDSIVAVDARIRIEK